jgi:hypothetical protein
MHRTVPVFQWWFLLLLKMKDQLKGYHFKDVVEVQMTLKIILRNLQIQASRNLWRSCTNADEICSFWRAVFWSQLCVMTSYCCHFVHMGLLLEQFNLKMTVF